MIPESNQGKLGSIVSILLIVRILHAKHVILWEVERPAVFGSWINPFKVTKEEAAQNNPVFERFKQQHNSHSFLCRWCP